MDSLFTDTHITRADCRLVERALRAGWLTPEKRAEVQQKVYNKLWTVEKDPDETKSFIALAGLLEKSYEFDVKLAEREELRQEKRVLQAKPIPRNAIESTTTGGTIEDRRSDLVRRIAAARGAGHDAGGT